MDVGKGSPCAILEPVLRVADPVSMSVVRQQNERQDPPETLVLAGRFRIEWDMGPSGEKPLYLKSPDNERKAGCMTKKTIAGFGACAVLAATWACAGAPPTIAVGVRKASCKEGADGVDGVAAFVIKRSEASEAAIDVSITMSGTAGNGIDYEEVLPVIHMPAGAEPVTVVIKSVKDSVVEFAETVKLTVNPGSGYLVGPEGSATVNILSAP